MVLRLRLAMGFPFGNCRGGRLPGWRDRSRLKDTGTVHDFGLICWRIGEPPHNGRLARPERQEHLPGLAAAKFEGTGGGKVVAGDPALLCVLATPPEQKLDPGPPLAEQLPQRRP